MSPDHFKVKPRGFDPQSYKYIFTPKHHEVLAKYCAALLTATNCSPDAAKAVCMIRAMLEADNNKFKPSLFLRRIEQLMDQKS